MLAHPQLHDALTRAQTAPPAGVVGLRCVARHRLLRVANGRRRSPRDRCGTARLRERRARPRGCAVDDAQRARHSAVDRSRAPARTPQTRKRGIGSGRRCSTTRWWWTADRNRCRPGPFHWSHTAHGTAHTWRTNPGFDYLEASHDGYAPLEQRRHVLAAHGDLLIVADLLSGGGTHDVQVHWHLDPAVDGRRSPAGKRSFGRRENGSSSPCPRGRSNG